MRSEGRLGQQAVTRGTRSSALPHKNNRRRRTDQYAPSREPSERERAALASLDKLSRGVFLLDADGAVVFANRAAEAMVGRNDGLSLRRGRLQFRCENSQAALESFLANADDVSESLLLCTRGASRSVPYRVLVSPLEHGAGYSVFVYEPNGGQKPLPVSVLKRLYRLTTAEANLANELFAGKALAEAARARGVSINTAKYTLKSIFSKCEVRSRAELLLLLSLGPRTL